MDIEEIEEEMLGLIAENSDLGPNQAAPVAHAVAERVKALVQDAVEEEREACFEDQYAIVSDNAHLIAEQAIAAWEKEALPLNLFGRVVLQQTLADEIARWQRWKD